MSNQRYWGKGAHMSAGLKADYKRVRKLHPERYIMHRVEETSMDGTGKVTTIKVLQESKAIPLAPAARHRLSYSNERH